MGRRPEKVPDEKVPQTLSRGGFHTQIQLDNAPRTKGIFKGNVVRVLCSLQLSRLAWIKSIRQIAWYTSKPLAIDSERKPCTAAVTRVIVLKIKDDEVSAITKVFNL